jgi:ABC-2 type transport system permease protein
VSVQASAGRVPPVPGAREVRGPSAYGGGLRRFAYLTWIMGLTEYRLTYFGSALGYLWALVRPLMMFGVLYVVFTKVVRFGADIPSYPVVLLLNIVLFGFFSDATTRSVNAVVEREAVVRKMQFPGMVIPLSRVLTGVLNLLLSLVAVFVFLLIYGIDPMWTWLLLPLVLLPLAALTVGVSMILSALYVRFRDVMPIWSVLATLLFYGTPVLYTIESVPESWQRVVLLNPLADLLEQARHWIVDPDSPGFVNAIGGAGWALVPIAIGVLICVAGVWIFNREAPRIAERL